jgi:hypothetical protein
MFRVDERQTFRDHRLDVAITPGMLNLLENGVRQGMLHMVLICSFALIALE